MGRSIPAWAGKPPKYATMPWCQEVYPRVGGETNNIFTKLVPSKGLSPRGRGNQTQTLIMPAATRSIPAWAGKPQVVHDMLSCLRVYPRVGGETAHRDAHPVCRGGLSPRGRGNLHLRLLVRTPLRSIPAWAGKPQYDARRTQLHRVYPRVGGETDQSSASFLTQMGLSPRGRGNLCAVRHVVCIHGSIPAWAGKPPTTCAR